MKIEGVVGPAQLADGTDSEPRLGRSGEQIVTELHGKYFEQAWRGNLYHASIPLAGVALVASGVTAGFALYNPIGSGKLMSLIEVRLGLVSGTLVVGTIMHGVNTNPTAVAVTGVTPLTPVSGLIGASGNPVGKAFATATLPVAPTPLRPLAIKYPSAAASAPAVVSDLIDGQIVLSPGTSWCLFVVGADTTPLELGSVSWEEVAV